MKTVDQPIRSSSRFSFSRTVCIVHTILNFARLIVQAFSALLPTRQMFSRISLIHNISGEIRLLQHMMIAKSDAWLYKNCSSGLVGTQTNLTSLPETTQSALPKTRRIFRRKRKFRKRTQLKVRMISWLIISSGCYRFN